MYTRTGVSNVVWLSTILIQCLTVSEGHNEGIRSRVTVSEGHKEGIRSRVTVSEGHVLRIIIINNEWSKSYEIFSKDWGTKLHHTNIVVINYKGVKSVEIPAHI